MKSLRFNRYAFTLIELIFVAMIIGLIMPAIFSLYNFIIRSNREINARQDTIQQGYEFFERLNILMQDYTIDYEEYFNRQMVGCVDGGSRGSGFTRNIGQSGYCTEFTAYGNENSTSSERQNGITSKYHDIYYCSSKSEKNTIGLPIVVEENKCGTKVGRQSYGQYEALFVDVGKNTDKDGNVIGDGDDYNRGSALNNINAIAESNHIQELYFISHDGKSRLFFRRKLYNQNGEYNQYKIEMLRLRGFDAGIKHNFEVSSENVGLYDGKIDTWACDIGMGFIGHGAPIDSITYSGYNLPADEDDCWIPLTYGSTSISARNIGISPTTDSDLSWNVASRQINAYMKILTVNGVYLPYYTTGTISNSVSDFKVPLETIINMKDFYRE